MQFGPTFPMRPRKWAIVEPLMVAFCTGHGFPWKTASTSWRLVGDSCVTLYLPYLSWNTAVKLHASGGPGLGGDGGPGGGGGRGAGGGLGDGAQVVFPHVKAVIHGLELPRLVSKPPYFK